LVIELRDEVILVERDNDPTELRKPRGRGELVIISVLGLRRSTGHHDEWSLVLQRSQNRTHSGVRHDEFRVAEHLVELGAVEKPPPAQIGGRLVGSADLRQHFTRPSASLGPLVDSGNQPFERKLSPHSHEDPYRLLDAWPPGASVAPTHW
jgi:hypothetical protein